MFNYLDFLLIILFSINHSGEINYSSFIKYEFIESPVKINNINISVKQAGNGQDMILIHGIFASKEIMNPLFEYYADKYHVVSFDVRGHGKSDKPAKFDLDDYADDLKELINELNLHSPIVIGLSMGSYIALKTAEKYPKLLSKIVLLGTRGKGEISLMEKAYEENHGNTNIDLKEMGRPISKRVYAPPTTPQQIADFYRGNRSEVELTNEERKNVYASLSHYDMISDADKVEIPVLLLVGEYDKINPPEESVKVRDCLPTSELVIIKDAGHIVFLEKEDEVISLINEFL